MGVCNSKPSVVSSASSQGRPTPSAKDGTNLVGVGTPPPFNQNRPLAMDTIGADANALPFHKNANRSTATASSTSSQEVKASASTTAPAVTPSITSPSNRAAANPSSKRRNND
eukprot:scaffold13000_cov193-Alexandrium_tamarense.AAC.19